MNYRRAYLPGGSFFFTLVTHKRRPILTSHEAIDVLRQAFRHTRASRPFKMPAIVILPDHLHCIWTLPPGDTDFSTRWRLIKTYFTKHCDSSLKGQLDSNRRAKQQQAVWQHRFWEHALQDEDDFNRHVDYIHFNPVKHGHVESPGAWPYSSFSRHVQQGVYAPNWGDEELDFSGVGAE